jgi:hypothetical protein
LTRIVRGVALCAAILLALWVLWVAAHSLRWPIINDASLFHYVAWCIADGARPYADVFDFQMPGTLLIHLAFVRAFGASDVSWRAFDLAVLVACAWLIVRTLQRFGPLAQVAGTTTYALWHLALGAWNTGQRDFVIGALLLGAAERVLALKGDRRDLARACVAGALAGAAVAIKPTAALFVVFVIACCGRWSGRRAALACLAASTVVPLACIAWVVSSGAWPAFVEIVREYLFGVHPLMERVPPLEVLRRWLGNGFALPLCIAAAVAIASGPRSRERIVLAAGVLFGLVHLAIQAKGWEYHFEPAALFLCALAASALAPAAGAGSRTARSARLAGALIALASLARAAAAIAPRAEHNVATPERVEYVRIVVDAVCADLRELVPIGARAQVYDSGPYGIEALLRLGLRQPTRFTYDHPLLVDDGHPYVQALRSEFIAALERSPPAALVIFGFDPRSGTNEELRRFDAFARLVAADYALARDRGSWRVYVPKSANAGEAARSHAR